MKKSRKQLLVLCALFVSLNVLPVIVHAQGPDDGTVSDPDAPIDGGISLLIAAGIGYGIKRVKDDRKKKADSLS